ncbi:MAG: hypothetical protein J6S23_05080 [Clostridia bacterium]|nr:hypothetical protein [Clostridia bacterium]
MNRRFSKYLLLNLVLFISIVVIVSVFEIKMNALDNEIGNESIELDPKFSALNIDIEDSLTISYENIDISDFECSINANGITASIVEDSDYLQCEVEAIEGVEFGELTVSAISDDGTELISTVYTYNSGEKLYYSEFAKDQALCEGMNECLEGAFDYFTWKYWEEEYSGSMSKILSGSPSVISANNDTTTISGNIYWETDNIHTTLPLRNAYVEIIAKTNYEYIVLDSGYTRANGEYSLEVANNVFSQYEDIYFRVNLEAYTFKVRSGWHTFAYFFDEKISDIASPGYSLKFDPCILYDISMAIYKATYVHQSMVIAERFAAEMGFESDTKIRVTYPAGNKNNPNPNALSYSAFCWGPLETNKYCAIGWHNYNDVNTVVHEYSHYIQCSMGNYGEEWYEILLELPTHDPNIDLYANKKDKSFAMHLTWTEGWGYAFAALAQKYYQTEYVGLTNYVTNIPFSGYYIGEFQEDSVTSFLWDLIDPMKTNWNIGVSSPVLDYQLPWTPQEWWDMTTVQGTYRLPDFINLIENESYNFGVDLDYKQIKEYIAEKLTLYNIAPEIISVDINSVVTNPPIINLIINGSTEHPNNAVVVTIYDSSNKMLAKSDKIPVNKGHLEAFNVPISSDLWTEAINKSKCNPDGTTTLKISVEGYREDDTDDIYATSGPYTSKYYTINIAIPHNFQLVSSTSTAHTYGCTDCNYSVTSEHDMRLSMSISPTEHGYKCHDCGYVDESTVGTHSYDYWVFVNETTHRSECTCGARGTTTASHAFTLPDRRGLVVCVGCSYTKIFGGDGSGNVVMSITRESLNGSYILHDGTIMLVDEDIEAYLNGTLVFYDKNNVPQTQ